MSDDRMNYALELLQKAYRMQMDGELDLAVSLYLRSIELHPTAEAYTFLGWTYRAQGKLDAAIEECKKAIATDPSFGNPYNDIGAYLIEQGKADESLPWLEKAINSERYQSYHYPWYNMGRALLTMEAYTHARKCFERALDISPNYQPAQEALAKIKRTVQ